jgi:hypothetical protein
MVDNLNRALSRCATHGALILPFGTVLTTNFTLEAAERPFMEQVVDQ